MGASLLLAVLVETVGPALRDPLPGPDVVRVFGEPVHQLLHLRGQLDGAQIEGRGFVSVRLEVRLVGKPD